MEPAAATTQTDAEPQYLSPLQRRLREDGRQQRWLAKKIGKHESYVSNVVRGMVPDSNTKTAIADTLGCKVNELWPPSQS